MAANKAFGILRHQLSCQKWEKHFYKGIFFHEIWPGSKECKYNYMADIKLLLGYDLRDRARSITLLLVLLRKRRGKSLLTFAHALLAKVSEAIIKSCNRANLMNIQVS